LRNSSRKKPDCRQQLVVPVILPHSGMFSSDGHPARNPAPKLRGSGFFIDEVFNIDQRIEHCVATIAPSPQGPLAFIGDENARLRSRPI
jgi:hypothetical protein